MATVAPETPREKVNGQVMIPLWNEGGGNCFYLAVARHPKVFEKFLKIELKDAAGLKHMNGKTWSTKIEAVANSYIRKAVVSTVSTPGNQQALEVMFTSHSGAGKRPPTEDSRRLESSDWSMMHPSCEEKLATWTALYQQPQSQKTPQQMKQEKALFKQIRDDYGQMIARPETYADNFQIINVARIVKTPIHIVQYTSHTGSSDRAVKVLTYNPTNTSPEEEEEDIQSKYQDFNALIQELSNEGKTLKQCMMEDIMVLYHYTASGALHYTLLLPNEQLTAFDKIDANAKRKLGEALGRGKPGLLVSQTSPPQESPTHKKTQEGRATGEDKQYGKRRRSETPSSPEESSPREGKHQSSRRRIYRIRKAPGEVDEEVIIVPPKQTEVGVTGLEEVTVSNEDQTKEPERQRQDSPQPSTPTSTSTTGIQDLPAESQQTTKRNDRSKTTKCVDQRQSCRCSENTQKKAETTATCVYTGCSIMSDKMGWQIHQLLNHIRQTHHKSEQSKDGVVKDYHPTRECFKRHLRKLLAEGIIVDQVQKIEKLYICPKCEIPSLQKKGHKGKCPMIQRDQGETQKKAAGEKSDGTETTRTKSSETGNRKTGGKEQQHTGEGHHKGKESSPQRPSIALIPITEEVKKLIITIPDEAFIAMPEGQLYSPPTSPNFQIPWINLEESIARLIVVEQEKVEKLEKQQNNNELSALWKLLLILPRVVLYKPSKRDKKIKPNNLIISRVQPAEAMQNIASFLKKWKKKWEKRNGPDKDKRKQPGPGEVRNQTEMDEGASTTSTSTTTTTTTKSSRATIPNGRITRAGINWRANHMASQGDLGKAVALLDPHKKNVIQVNEEGLQLLRDLHPSTQKDTQTSVANMDTDNEVGDQMNRQEDIVLPSPGEDFPTLQYSEDQIFEKQMQKAWTGLKRLAAAGVTGWCKDLCPLRGTVPDMTGLKRVVMYLAKGKLPSGIAPFVYGGKITPLEKQPGSQAIRPIVVGEFLVKWAAKTLLQINAEEFEREFQKVGQHGVCVKSGLETIVHMVRTTMELATEAGATETAIAQLDFSNAYNTVSRDLIRRHLVNKGAKYIGLLQYFDAHYPTDKPIYLQVKTSLEPPIQNIKSEEGVHQGDPLGPAFFAMGLAEITERAKQKVAQSRIISAQDQILGDTEQQRVMSELDTICYSASYLDDHHIMGPIDMVLQMIKEIQISIEELQAGLKLNMKKSNLWASRMKREEVDTKCTAQKLADINIVDPQTGLLVLRVPIGTNKFVGDHVKKMMTEHTIPLIKNLNKVGSHQLHLLLLRYCAVPRATFVTRNTQTFLIKKELEQMDDAIREGLGEILDEPLMQGMKKIASLPIRLGGIGLTSASETAKNAFAASAITAIPTLESNQFIHNLMDRVKERRKEKYGAQSSQEPDEVASQNGRKEGKVRSERLQTSVSQVAENSIQVFWKEMDVALQKLQLLESPEEGGIDKKVPRAKKKKPKRGHRKKKKDVVTWISKGLHQSLRHIPRDWDTILDDKSTCCDESGTRRVQRALVQAQQWAKLVDIFCQTKSMTEQAKLLGQAQEGASDFLKAIPFNSKFAISNDALRWNLRRWMNSPRAMEDDVKIYNACTTQYNKDKTGKDSHLTPEQKAQHIYNCKHGGMLITRHDLVLQEISAMLKDAGVRHRVEPRNLRPDQGQKGEDIIAFGFPKHNQTSSIELAIVNPLQQSMLACSAEEPLYAANQRVIAKTKKYEEATKQYGSLNWAIVVEVTGGFSPSLRKLISTCATRAVHNERACIYNECQVLWSAPHFAPYWRQRISLALRRAMYDVSLKNKVHRNELYKQNNLYTKPMDKQKISVQLEKPTSKKAVTPFNTTSKMSTRSDTSRSTSSAKSSSARSIEVILETQNPISQEVEDRENAHTKGGCLATEPLTQDTEVLMQADN